MKIAILLATYNGTKYIKDQIDSILKQTNVHVKIFISDDLSSDKTIEFIKQTYADYDNIVFLESKQKFGNATKNFLRLIKDVDFTNFDYIAFSDQDDIWNNDKLSHSVKMINEKNCDIYSSNVIAFWENEKKVLIDKAQPQTKYDFLFEAAGPGCTYVMNRTFADNFKKNILNNWNEANALWSHDWYCYAYARANNFKWFIDKKPTMYYRQHSINEMGANVGLVAFIKRVKKVLQKSPLEEVLKIATLIGIENSEFVKKWSNLSRFSIFKLAFYANLCRRKTKDKIFFFFACIFMSTIIKPNSKNKKS